ncbi:MAG: aspartyl protease family protein [Bauldia sp.]
MKLQLWAAGAVAMACLALPVMAQDNTETADALFVAGQFARAEGLYKALVKETPTDAVALTRLGALALYSNRLQEAEDWLEKAIVAKADATEAQVLLAETFYRRNDFANAARSLEAAGSAAASLPTWPSFTTLVLDKLQSFANTRPYEIEAKGPRTVLKFVKTDPLPIVKVTVNGKEAVFFIDTGAAEVLLDTQFAKELGVPQFAATPALFAGGQGGSVGSGKLETLGLGNWTLKNLPVQIVDTRAFSDAFGVRIDGCIGTMILSRFLSTMDYARGELVLEPKRTKVAQTPGKVAIRFWLTGDHVIVANGVVNNLPPALFFVDSGLTSGVNLRQSMFEVAGIRLQEDKASKAQGGGGSFSSVPYDVAKVALGPWREKNVPGVFDGPQVAEDKFGFYVQGLVGHEFLKPHRVTYDFARMRIHIVP